MFKPGDHVRIIDGCPGPLRQYLGTIQTISHKDGDYWRLEGVPDNIGDWICFWNDSELELVEEPKYLMVKDGCEVIEMKTSDEALAYAKYHPGKYQLLEPKYGIDASEASISVGSRVVVLNTEAIGKSQKKYIGTTGTVTHVGSTGCYVRMDLDDARESFFFSELVETTESLCLTLQPVGVKTH
jgi:hypothetical protein